jgi:aminocarboxymuconate-semialdehyde decarboxylase
MPSLISPIGLDVHAHLVPIDADMLGPLPGVSWSDAKRRLIVDGHELGVLQLFQPDSLIQWMGLHRIERALISVPPPVYRQHLDETSGLAWARYLNAGLLAVQNSSRNTLVALAHVPLEHPAVALEVIREMLANNVRGFAGVAGGRVSTDYAGPELMPVWELLDSNHCFIFLHPGSCADGRLRAHYLENLVGNPYETTVAASQLLMGGVLERLPNLQVCLAHGGGMLAAIAGRLQRGFETARPGVDTAAECPMKAVRRLFVDCVVHDSGFLHKVADMFGQSQVLFGSDWPFPLGLLEPREQLTGTSVDLLERIFATNHRGIHLASD